MEGAQATVQERYFVIETVVTRCVCDFAEPGSVQNAFVFAGLLSIASRGGKAALFLRLTSLLERLRSIMSSSVRVCRAAMPA